MSSNWPDKPLIRIIRGNIGYKDVSGGLARMTPTGNYRTGKANGIADDRVDHIDEWGGDYRRPHRRTQAPTECVPRS